jgi:hypothetical protein
VFLSLVMCRPAFVSRLVTSMEHPVPDFHDHLVPQRKKPGLLARPGFSNYDFNYDLKVYQPRVRDRIMKLSKVYSATCHHRYWSER